MANGNGNGDLIEIQVIPSAIQPSVTRLATDMVLPAKRSADRLRHFPANVYDLNAESHLSRFLKVLLGDSGVGRLRKRINVQRMRASLTGAHFYDLDRFYGPLFNMKRVPDEILNINPYAGTATRDQWDDTYARDASFRSRIEQLASAIAYGPTPVGMELIAEALLAVDCEILETYIQADSTFRTWGEIEALGTYGDLEAFTYGELESGGTQMAGNDRRLFVVRPMRQITLAEAHYLTKVLDRLKPADARYEIEPLGVPLYEPLVTGPVYADSVHWEILSKVIPVTPFSPSLLPYTVMSDQPEEQPKPPFSGYQGEAWSYISDLAGVAASYKLPWETTSTLAPVQRVTYVGGTYVDFAPQAAILPTRLVQSGRGVSDAILVSYPYATHFGVLDQFAVNRTSEAIAQLYVDGMPLDKLVEVLETLPRTDPFQQNPENRYWVTLPRLMEDPMEEILEVRFQRDSWVNYFTFETAKYPHQVIVEIFDTEGGQWVEIHRVRYTESIPRILNPGEEVALRAGHPQHTYPNHWYKVSQKVRPMLGSRLRVRLQRIEGLAPQQPQHTVSRLQETVEVPYTLAIRSFDVGYRVSTRSDFEFIEDDVIGRTADMLGSQVQFSIVEQTPDRAVDESEVTAWRCEPQPVPYAVVNFYMDTRAENGVDGQVIDRFYINPTHVGPSLSIYYSNDPQTPDGTTAFFEARNWQPIPRNYFLQKGYLHIPQTRARFFKFEISNLVAEPYESFMAITRTVKLFPPQLIHELGIGYGHAEEAMLPGMTVNVDTSSELRYTDALRLLDQVPDPLLPGQYRPTEALWVPDPAGQSKIRHDSWQFGFIPWHQTSEQYPRFNLYGTHTYDHVQVRHDTKVAFFCGLRAIKAYRTKYEESENRVTYWDTMDDFRNLEQPFGWAFNPGYLTTEGTTPPVEVASGTFHSRDNVKAIQFATVQSDPQQLIYDPEFRDPTLMTYTWDDPDGYQRVGDAQLVYDPTDFSVLNIRHVIPPPRPVEVAGGMVHGIVNPIFRERAFQVSDDEAAAATIGGLKTSIYGLSPAGRAYAAARISMLTDQSSPIYLRVYDSDGDVLLAETEFVARKGEMAEGYVGFDIPEANTLVYVEVVQEGKSDDMWKVYALSLFDDGMVWEFSVNGGSDWYPAINIRNNQYGILTFPAVGNQLRWRATAYREDRWVSAIKLRPHYVSVGQGRPTGTNRGPNVSMYDHDVPIQNDPLFTTWTKPIPYWWFAASRRYPLLTAEGALDPSQFSRSYARPTTDTVEGLTDEATFEKTAGRLVQDSVAGLMDQATRRLEVAREASENLGATFSDSADWVFVWQIGIPGRSEIGISTFIGAPLEET